MKKKIAALLTVMAVTGLILTGCGSSSQKEEAAEEPAEEAVEETAEEAESTGMANPWSEAESSEEAAKGAGLDSMTLKEGLGLDLGEEYDRTYRYMDGIAEITLEFPASQIVIRKGTNAEDGDISGDYNEYANKWTKDINGIEVTCEGNRENEASKTTWTVDGISYSINAIGLGGDDDFGLQPEDLALIVGGLQ